MIQETSQFIFAQLPDYWMVGIKYFGLAYDSLGTCIKFTGELQQCTPDELNLMVSISKLFL
jgi:hypothetical protein